MKILLTVKNYWHYLIGPGLAFNLTTRVFHFVCLITLLALGYNIPFNYAVGLPYIAIASAIAFVIFCALYYLSRVLRKTPLARFIAIIIGNLLFIINYFLNSGINGPTSIFFISTIIVTVAIVPVKQYKYWITGNILIVLSLHLLQYYQPDLVPYTYVKVQDRYIDMSSAYLTVVAVAILSFYFFRQSYELEKASAEKIAKELKLLNDERNKLMSIIAHDLRSPLGNIQSYLELLVEIDISEEERYVIKKRLLQATRGTLEMLNNVLDWTKSQMNGLNFALTPVNVFKLLASQLQILMDIAANKKITLEVSIDPNITIIGNGEMLQLVVRNIVSNAIKFTASGGYISVHTKIQDDKCLIVVNDSGNGTPANLSNDIFQLSGSSMAGTMNEKGVGLGLVLCKEYTEVQGGTIWFECDSVSGVTFFVQLPLLKTHTSNDNTINLKHPF